MKNISLYRLALMSAFLVSALPFSQHAFSATQSDNTSSTTSGATSTTPPSTSNSSAKAATTVVVKKPTTPAADTSTPAVVAAPAAPAAPVVTPAQTSKTQDTPTSGSLTVGDLTVSHARIIYKKDHFDFFCSIKNVSNADERLGGAGTPLSSGDVVMVTKDKDGKEQESPMGIVLTANKTVDLSSDTTWIRIKDVKSEPKSTDIVPVTLYFRRSPNAVLKLTLSSSEGSSLLDWFKK